MRAVLAAGAVGVNLEDGGGPVELHRDRVAAAREAGGSELFVNARTDLYLFGIGEPEGRLAETIARAGVYAEAGADGIFVPGVTDPQVLRTLAAEIPLPLNVLAGPGAPPVDELAAIGVRRVSIGTGLAEVAYAAADRAARELLAAGTYRTLEGGLDYAELQKLLD
jgi:2-methylisocitrate lyase-like PEP mutase family enzyme